MHLSPCFFTLMLCCTDGLPFCKTRLTCNGIYLNVPEFCLSVSGEKKTAVKPGFKCCCSPPPSSALRYSGHPVLAVVPDSLWKKDGSLRWLLGKAHNHIQTPLLSHMKPVRLTGLFIGSKSLNVSWSSVLQWSDVFLFFSLWFPS